MLTDQVIEDAKRNTVYSLETDRHHEHNDCIRIAYEWLDAQVKTQQPSRHPSATKAMIEKWAGRYVSRSDVEVAATLHPDVKGKYPYFNISLRLVWPSQARLSEIPSAFSQRKRIASRPAEYKRSEE